MEPILIVVAALEVLVLLSVWLQVLLHARASAPRQRRLDEMEAARQAVRAAEQLGGRGHDKAVTATRFVLEAHPKCTAHRARMLVEAAVKESKR